MLQALQKVIDYFFFKTQVYSFLSEVFTLLNLRFKKRKARFFGCFDKRYLLAIILPFVYNDN